MTKHKYKNRFRKNYGWNEFYSPKNNKPQMAKSIVFMFCFLRLSSLDFVKSLNHYRWQKVKQQHTWSIRTAVLINVVNMFVFWLVVQFPTAFRMTFKIGLNIRWQRHNSTKFHWKFRLFQNSIGIFWEYKI